jgi:hypothetical protein
MKPRLPRGAVLMISLLAMIALLNRASDWWDDTFGPTGTGPRSVQTTR